MKSKTLRLIEKYQRDLQEQAEDPNAAPEGAMPVEDPTAAAPEPQVLQMTTDAEDNYILQIINAALFEPSSVDPSQKQQLLDLQEIMMNKDAFGITNARNEVYDKVRLIIGDPLIGFKKDLDAIE